MLTAFAVSFLIVCRALDARVDAVGEILSTQSGKLTVLRQLLRGLPDLARGLCRIQYGKVSISVGRLNDTYLTQYA